MDRVDADTAGLERYGWSPRWQALAAGAASDGVAGRVLRHDGHALLVGLADDVRHVHLRASTPPIAVGDWVRVDPTVDAVTDVLARHSLLQRSDPSTGDAQLLAANVDVVAIVCGLDRSIRPGRIQRFVTLAWEAGAVPLVVLTKADLEPDDIDDAVATAEAAAPGCDVVAVSSVDSSGIDRLRAQLTGRTVAFVGESGAGKSTLLNAVARTDLAATGSVRSGDAKGRHTTTARQLHVVGGDVRIIDTPGLRAVGLWAGVDAVDEAFDDITSRAVECRFADCGHDTEPGCAVLAAVERGDLASSQLDGWRALRREAASVELRADPAAARRADRQFGKVVREVKRMKRR